MRLHFWDDENVPPVLVLDDECVQVVDYPHWNAFEVGDQIQYLTEVGTSVYFVVDVQHEGKEMTRVTIKAA